MSLNSIMNIATSGLYASQAAIRTTSQNVSNVNTKGYTRLDHNQTAREIGGTGNGVDVGRVTRAADRFLQAAAMASRATSGTAGAKFEFLDKIQAAFGDPTSSSSLFSSLNRALGAFETGALNAGSTTARRDALSQLQAFISRLNTVGEDVKSARAEADVRIGEEIASVNTILANIAKTNGDIQRGHALGDGTGSEQKMSDLINQLSKYMDVRVSIREDGVNEVRTSDGVLLAGFDHATLKKDVAPVGSSSYARIQIQYGSDPTYREFEPNLQGGSLRGLLDVRDKDLGQIAYSLGELAGGIADALNAAHNQNATLPPLAKTSGVDTGLLAADGLNFTGKTTIGIADATGKLVRRIDIDFTAGTLSVDGGATAPLGTTIGSMATAINTALGTFGTASFANGKLQLETAPPVPATATPNGFIFDEPATDGSSRGGRAFAHFFGLNDLVKSGGPVNYNTGLTAGDAHGFPVGSKLGLKVLGPNGAVLANKQITIPAGTIGDVLNALNDPVTGLGTLGGFSLDPQGQIKWSANAGPANARLEVVDDIGPRTGTARGFSEMFGISPADRETRATGLQIMPEIVANPAKLAFARPDLTGIALGAVALGAGDSRGAQALFDVSKSKLVFTETGGVNPKTFTLGDFAASVGGDVGRLAANSEADKASAEAFEQEADTRRSNIEGVNLDEELVKLTSYQQAYSAAARMLRAVDEMYETLLQAV